MSPSSMFSRGSRSPFVFWPSKISRSLQNHVTVLSCRKKYFVFQYHKLYLWFGLVTTILLTNVNYDCHLIPWLPLGNQHEHGVDHWVAEPVFFNIFQHLSQPLSFPSPEGRRSEAVDDLRLNSCFVFRCLFHQEPVPRKQSITQSLWLKRWAKTKVRKQHQMVINHFPSFLITFFFCNQKLTSSYTWPRVWLGGIPRTQYFAFLQTRSFSSPGQYDQW